MIVIIDYHTGNLRSVQNMLKRVGSESVISDSPVVIKKATKLILPGVGSFDYGMEKLEKLGLVEVLDKKANKEKVPLLGICLGAQLLTKSSEEGSRQGLGCFDAKVVRFNNQNFPNDLKIPHMAWADVRYSEKSKLFGNFHEIPRFYFVHSYHFITEMANEIAATAEYGYQFVAALEKENILAVQFHPEKSHKFGTQLLKNFVENY